AVAEIGAIRTTESNRLSLGNDVRPGDVAVLRSASALHVDPVRAISRASGDQISGREIIRALFGDRDTGRAGAKAARSRPSIRMHGLLGGAEPCLSAGGHGGRARNRARSDPPGGASHIDHVVATIDLLSARPDDE